MHVPVMRLKLNCFMLSKQVVFEDALRVSGLRSHDSHRRSCHKSSIGKSESLSNVPTGSPTSRWDSTGDWTSEFRTLIKRNRFNSSWTGTTTLSPIGSSVTTTGRNVCSPSSLSLKNTPNLPHLGTTSALLSLSICVLLGTIFLRGPGFSASPLRFPQTPPPTDPSDHPRERFSPRDHLAKLHLIMLLKVDRADWESLDRQSTLGDQLWQLHHQLVWTDLQFVLKIEVLRAHPIRPPPARNWGFPRGHMLASSPHVFPRNSVENATSPHGASSPVMSIPRPEHRARLKYISTLLEVCHLWSEVLWRF